MDPACALWTMGGMPAAACIALDYKWRQARGRRVHRRGAQNVKWYENTHHHGKLRIVSSQRYGSGSLRSRRTLP